MEALVEQGLVRSIGISNFNSEQTQLIVDSCSIKPAVNQVELHPYLSQEKLTDFCKQRDIAITAYSPFGSPDRPWAPTNDVKLLEDPKLQSIGEKHAKSPAQVVCKVQGGGCSLRSNVAMGSLQVILRWMIQRDVITIPKSVTPSRIKQNFEVSVKHQPFLTVTSSHSSCSSRCVLQVFDFALPDEDMQLINSLNRNLRYVAPDALKASPNYPFHIEF